MTDIEFKVQFVSESFSGKGSCKGTVFKEMAGWRGETWKASAGVGGARGLHPAPSSRSGGVVSSCPGQQRVNQIS